MEKFVRSERPANSAGETGEPSAGWLAIVNRDVEQLDN
jgi:hypothetical protein